MDYRGFEKEAAELQCQIFNLLRETQQKANARLQEEKLLVLSAANEKCVRDLLRCAEFCHADTLQVLQVSGEEDLIEEECLNRYKAYLEEKAALFSSSAVELEAVTHLMLSRLFDSAERNDLQKHGEDRSVLANLDHRELHEFERLWESAKFMQRLTEAGTLEKRVTSFVDNFDVFLTDDRKLSSSETLLHDAIDVEQSRLAAAEARVRATEQEISALKAKLDFDAGSEEDLALESASNEDGKISFADKNALDALENSNERWVQTQKAVKASQVTLYDRLDKIKHRTILCQQTGRALLSSTKELEESIHQLRVTCGELEEIWKRKAAQCLEQERLLMENEASCTELKEKVSKMADNEDAKALELNNAEFAHRSTINGIERAIEHLHILNTSSAKINEELKEVRSERERLNEEIAYLAGLIEDKSNVEQILSRATRDHEHPRTPLAAQNYLCFIQKAREQKNNCL